MTFTRIEDLAGTPDELAYAFLLAAAGLFAIRFLPVRGSGEQAARVRAALCAALGARWAAGLLIYYYAPYGAFAEDNWSYARYGRALAEYWQGGGGPGLPPQSEFFYYTVNAVVFTLVGFAPLVVATLNCLAGVATVWLAHRVAADLVDEETAVYAAWLVALFPSLVLWSSMNLRDVWVLVGILCVAASVLDVYRGRWTPAVLTAAVGFGCAGLFRTYLIPMLLLGLVMGAVMASTRRVTASVSAAVVLVAGAIALTLLLAPALNADTVGDAVLQDLTAQRRSLASGESVYLGDAEFRSITDVVLFLPLGAAYFFFGPFPWAVEGGRQAMTLPEVFLWYALVPYIAIGARAALRRSASASLVLLCVATSIAVPFILVSSNLGTAYRHRAQVLVILLVFAAAGLAARRANRRRESFAGAPAGPLLPAPDARAAAPRAGRDFGPPAGEV
jgi:4-amino-4-deoxy-L-arabinose transferase-like glycosyltransferase